MTLRARLVAALVALVALGLGGFIAATYISYRSSEYQRLDQQLRATAPAIDSCLDMIALGQPGQCTGPPQGGTGPPPAGGHYDDYSHGSNRGPNLGAPRYYWAERVNPGGPAVYSLDLPAGSPRPQLPRSLPVPSPGGTIYSVGSTSGSTQWRVIDVAAANGGVTVVAIPAGEVTNALHRLLLIEALGALALLIVLSGGAWLVLRSGLRPLERMAATASSISAGDLSRLSLRVSPADGRSEVGQLGLALNTMLGDIEAAFAEREATEQRLRQFLADASHELRTPLTSIQGFAELFRLHGSDARIDTPTIMRRIEEESARMKVLVEELLLLARLDQHGAAPREPVDLAVLAADACTDAVAIDPLRPVTLDAPEPVIAPVVEGHVRQAIGNLLTNAVRHTPAGAPIDVSCRRDGTTAILTVRDHGGGLDQEALTHAFDRFWQGDRARVGSGAGLGLSIVAAIAKEHDGSATAANHPDGGAVFTLSLPAPAVPASGGPVAPAVDEGLGRSPGHPRVDQFG